MLARLIGLLRRGKDPVEAGITGIAVNACRYVRCGRRLGTGTAGRGAMDVHNPRAQKKHGLRLISLDHPEDTAVDVPRRAWREWLAQDRRTSPGDLAAIRLDFATWLAGLPERKRRIAELLALGNETSTVARTVSVSQGRVSQVRLELEASWRQFQGEAPPREVAPARRPVGRPRKADHRASRRPRQRADSPVLVS